MEKDEIVNIYIDLKKRAYTFSTLLLILCFINIFVLYDSYYSYRDTFLKEQIISSAFLPNYLDSLELNIKSTYPGHNLPDDDLLLDDEYRTLFKDYSVLRMEQIKVDNHLKDIKFSDFELVGTGIKVSAADFTLIFAFIILIFYIGISLVTDKMYEITSFANAVNGEASSSLSMLFRFSELNQSNTKLLIIIFFPIFIMVINLVFSIKAIVLYWDISFLFFSIEALFIRCLITSLCIILSCYFGIKIFKVTERFKKLAKPV